MHRQRMEMGPEQCAQVRTQLDMGFFLSISCSKRIAKHDLGKKKTQKSAAEKWQNSFNGTLYSNNEHNEQSRNFFLYVFQFHKQFEQYGMGRGTFQT